MPINRVVATAIIALTAASAFGALYRWVDEKGQTQYSDKPPEKGKGTVQMNDRGIVIKQVETGLTPEQRKAKEGDEARKKAEEAKAAEQRRLDLALLQSFTSVNEIDLKRDREIQGLDSTIENLRGQERMVSGRLAEDRRRLEGFERSKKPPPDSVKDDIARGEAEKKILDDEIKRKQQEIVDTRAKYEGLKKRYLELKPQSSSLLQPVPSTATGKK